MNITTKKSLLATMIALFTSGATVQAVAQSDENRPATASRALDEIIVTATKRETSLQDTALSITAFTTENLATQGIENFEGFARQTPGVVLSGVKNFNKFTIRGIQTSTTYSSNGEQKPVAVYVDEVPVSTFSIVTPDLRLYDVERVEVLRGPQGTAFGSGSMAGGVRILTKKASFDGFDASIRVDGGKTEGAGFRQRYSSMVNLPIIDEKLALRVVGYSRDEEGFIENVGTWGYSDSEENGSEEWGLRTSLRWQATDRLSAVFSVMHDDIDTNGLSTMDKTLGKYKRASFLGEKSLVETTNVSATLNYDWDWATLVSSTTYALSDTDWDLDLDAVLRGIMPFGYSERQEQAAIVQELRLVSNTDSDVEWLVGGFYLDRNTDFHGATFTTQAFLEDQGIDTSALLSSISPGVDQNPTIRAQENRESAVFGELTYHFTDTLSLTGGLRYTSIRFDDEITNKAYTTDILGLVFGGVGGVVATAQDSPLSISTGRQSVVTKRFNLAWKPVEGQNYYIMAAEGFRRSHPNFSGYLPNLVDPSDSTIIPKEAKSDSLWNYEIGAKTSWLNGRLQANIAAYYILWDDLQISLTRVSDGSPYTGNAGDAISKGLEAEFFARPSDEAEFGLNFTLARAEINSISAEDELLSGAVKGAKLASPDLQISAFGQYTWALSHGQSLYARVDVQYIGGYSNSLPNISGRVPITPNPNFEKLDSYENVNAQLGWAPGDLKVVLYGENILNNDDYIYANPATHTVNRYSTLTPRTFGIRFDKSF